MVFFITTGLIPWSVSFRGISSFLCMCFALFLSLSVSFTLVYLLLHFFSLSLTLCRAHSPFFVFPLQSCTISPFHAICTMISWFAYWFYPIAIQRQLNIRFISRSVFFFSFSLNISQSISMCPLYCILSSIWLWFVLQCKCSAQIHVIIWYLSFRCNWNYTFFLGSPAPNL